MPIVRLYLTQAQKGNHLHVPGVSREGLSTISGQGRQGGPQLSDTKQSLGDWHLHMVSQPLRILRLASLSRSLSLSRSHIVLGTVVSLSSSSPADALRVLHFRYATQVLGGPSAGAYFVSHGDYTAQLEKNLGATVTDAYFPNDHTVSTCSMFLHVPLAPSAPRWYS